MKKIIVTVLSLAMLVGSVAVLSGCADGSGVLKEVALSDADNPVIGNVGEYEVRLDEWTYLYESYKAQLVNMYGKEAVASGKYDKELSDKTCDALKLNAAALEVAAEYGISIDDKEVREYVSEQMDELAEEISDLLENLSSSEDATVSDDDINAYYREYLAENHLTDRYNRYVIAVDGCISLTVEKCVANGDVLTEENEVIEYIMGNFVRTWQVRVDVNSDNAAEARERAEMLAWILSSDLTLDGNRTALKEKLGIVTETEENAPTRSFYKRLVSAATVTEKMKILVGSKYNDDSYMTTLHGYYFTYGEYFEELENAAFALKEGETSDVISSGNAYYVILRLPLEADYVREIYDTLNGQYQYAYVDRLIDACCSEMSFSPAENIGELTAYVG